jgi:hypothetical protein
MILAFTVAISSTGFNWGTIISKQLSTFIRQAQVPKKGDTPTFYMASYLLDIVYARNTFIGMNLNWHSLELLVHVCFNILWENRYNVSYTIICDYLITCIYFFQFRKEFPRLLDEAKKVATKVVLILRGGCSQYQVQFKTFLNLYLNHSIIYNEK